MKVLDAIVKWKARVASVIFFLALVWVVFAKMDTPFHMDAEAAELYGEQQSASACATIYQYESMIARAKAQLNNPSIPDWKKDELRNSIQDWQSVVDRLRQRYDC